MPTQSIRRLLLLVASLAATPSSAEITAADYESEDLYAFIVHDMPDFDQRRLNDLPNDGACYCGPAASGNLLAYVATHGFSEVAPGVPVWDDWEAQINYAKATLLLSTFGNASDTGPSGSNCGTAYWKMRDELENRLGHAFTVQYDARNWNDATAPTLESIAQKAASNAAVGLIRFGRYEGSFDNDGVFIATSRINGHYVTVNKAVHAGTNRFLSFRDPGGGAYDTVQSAFKSGQFDVKKQPFTWTDGTTLTGERLGDPYANRSRMRMIDGYLSIAPKAGYTWGAYTPFKIKRITPEMERWAPNHTPQDHADVDAPVRLAHPLPGDIELAILTANQIKIIDQLTGGIRPLPPLPPGPIASMSVDRFGKVHAAINNTLAIINPAKDSMERLELSGVISSLATVHQFGTNSSFRVPVVQALLPQERQLATVMLTQQGYDVVYQAFAASVQMNDSSQFFLMSGFAFLLTDGSLQAFDTTSGLVAIDAGIPTFDYVRDVVIDDQNVILLSMGEERTYTAYQMDGWLQPLADHPMNGVESDGRLAIVRSSSNEPPWLLDGGQNVDFDEGMEDESEPSRDCRSDLNFDGKVDGADMGILLAEWGTSRSIADISRDGTVDGADLGLMLGAFGDCP